ncbi:LamG-like jellyroll fold domain-containing protein [Sunxiuqinia sp. sy24]|uniref:LamG-like jellyroll fold domain-containing protein n=1 Tax=Sunxiuqinia sp. sy24 TaxID=3461495 RepID=UPI0040456590
MAENKCFKASPNYIRVNTQNFTPPASQITTECWIKAKSFENWAAPVSYLTDNYHDESGFGLTLKDGKLHFMLKTVNMRGDEWNYNPGVKIEADQWVHIAGTYDGESIKIYKNGELIESKTTSGKIDWTFKPSSLHIGAFKDFNERFVFDGEIDEVRIWNTARSSSEINEFRNQHLNGKEEGLIAYYNFDTDNNTFIKDHSPNSLNGKLNIPTKEHCFIPSASMIAPKIKTIEINSPSSFTTEWEIAESTFTFDHYIVELSNTESFDRILKSVRSSNKQYTIDNLLGGSKIYVRIKGYCQEFGYTAYSDKQEITEFETALSVMIKSIAEDNKNNTQHKLMDYNILTSDFIGFPSRTKDIQFELKLSNQIPENINSGKIIIIGPSKSYETEFKQNSELSLFNLKPGKYAIHVKWGSTINNTPLTTNLRMEIKPMFFQQIYIQIILLAGLLILLYIGIKRYRFISYKALDKIKKEQLPTKETNQDWISPDELAKKASLIKETVLNEELYLDPKFNLKSLAEKIDIPHYHISRILKDYYELNFNDFINEFRVSEFIKQLKNSNLKHIKNSALAYQCGFYSESTFFRAFKKFMGKTPQQYQKELEEQKD